MHKITVGIVTLLLTHQVMAKSPALNQNDAIIARIAPVGKVCIKGKDCEAHKAGAKALASAQSGGTRTGEQIYQTTCKTCHETGLLNAPKKGDSAAWQARAKLEQKANGGAPLDALLKMAISGKNAMPPRGTCANCSDEELKNAIRYMSGLK